MEPIDFNSMFVLFSSQIPLKSLGQFRCHHMGPGGANQKQFQVVLRIMKMKFRFLRLKSGLK